MSSDIRYVRNGGVAIAYQVVGDSSSDLVYVSDFTSNLVYAWEHPHLRDFYERLARSFRLVLYDRRGIGLSDASSRDSGGRNAIPPGMASSPPSTVPRGRSAVPR
jgi:pimeloyl-ACP methyl ester carboxylesterase